MGTDSSLKMQVAMTFLPKLNTLLRLPFIERCGGIEGFFMEHTKALKILCPEFQLLPDFFDRKKALLKAEKELEAIDKYNIQLCSVEHTNYPFLLKQSPDGPLVFYYKGTLETEDTPYLAVVGTRNASEYGKNRVNRILQELSEMQHRLVIVSGLAYGIDITAHLASLRYHFRTYAVLGHGLNLIYPASHKSIAERILSENGALITEFPCASSTLPKNFLQRNRIIAGLCHATLVAESALKGGAMVTAQIAASYDREVYAIPGRPTDRFSQGCNYLIKQNIAILVEDGKDVAFNLGLNPSPVQPVQTSLCLFDTGDQEAVIKNILQQKGCKNIDELSICSGIGISELTALLLKLELEGSVLALPGKNYILS